MLNWNSTKLFPVPAPHRPSTAELEDLLRVLSQLKASGDAEFGAGYTYFGQFIAHDLSFHLDHSAPELDIDGPIDIAGRTLVRKPVLDLDGVYGGGPADSIIPFDKADGRFILGETGFGRDRDFVRAPDFRPLIGDPRNDENLIVAQIQVLFMRLHNRIVRDLYEEGERDPDALFENARAEVIKIYQYLVLHDFLRRLVPRDVYREVIVKGRGRLTSPNRRDPTIPLEVTEAAFRLHSLVRISYQLNDGRKASLETLLERTGERNVTSSRPPLLKAEDEVDWRHFFDFDNYPERRLAQRAKRPSPVIQPPLRSVGPNGRIDMLERNIVRGIACGLCTGQQACEEVRRRSPELAADLELTTLDGETDDVLSRLRAGNSIKRHTPLWLYLMRETGTRLGVLGGWLLADTLRTAVSSSEIRLSDTTDPLPRDLYRPLRSRVGNRRPITIEDVITYVDDLS